MSLVRVHASAGARVIADGASVIPRAETETARNRVVRRRAIGNSRLVWQRTLELFGTVERTQLVSRTKRFVRMKHGSGLGFVRERDGCPYIYIYPDAVFHDSNA